MCHKEIFARVLKERERQKELARRAKCRGDKWFECSKKRTSEPNKLTVLTEEVGEVAKAINDNMDTTDELIQTIAVCLAWLESK